MENVVCPWLPTSAFQKAVYDVYSRHNLTCTNVPGPAKKALVAGKPVVNCRFNVDGHVHPVVSILSYKTLKSRCYVSLPIHPKRMLQETVALAG
jgi:hypothetical protein